VTHFFRTEYTADWRVATMTPIQIALWDGYVMGGGVGISIHAPLTIATEKTVFAMPEAKIGFFTDVAGGWFLSRLRNSIGMYLGLTSAQLRGQDVVKAGVAKYFVESKDLDQLQQDLRDLVNTQEGLSDAELQKSVYTIVDSYAQPVSGEIPNEKFIKNLFSKGTYEDIYRALELNTDNKDFTLKALKQLDANSPLACKVIFEQISRHQDITLKDALKSDFRTCAKFMDGIDFFEGVRCLLVDKGDKPNWEFDEVSKVTPEEVEKYFMELPADMELKIE
jgi:3-hydroxyisobutyryl-CoA hydrolase